MFLKGNTIFMFPKGHACFQYILQVQNGVVYFDSIQKGKTHQYHLKNLGQNSNNINLVKIHL